METTKKSGAKKLSKWSMVVGVIWIAVWTAIKAMWPLISKTNVPFGLTESEIILSGITLAAMFTPVYISIILDKVKDIKLGV